MSTRRMHRGARRCRRERLRVAAATARRAKVAGRNAVTRTRVLHAVPPPPGLACAMHLQRGNITIDSENNESGEHLACEHLKPSKRRLISCRSFYRATPPPGSCDTRGRAARLGATLTGEFRGCRCPGVSRNKRPAREQTPTRRQRKASTCWPPPARRRGPPSSDDDEAQLAIAVAAEMARGEKKTCTSKRRGVY